MVKKKKLEDVFKTVGLPPYTYVKPSYYGEIRADIAQPGKHLLIEGPSGIGKSCVAFKVFEELEWAPDEDFIYLSCRDANAVERARVFLKAARTGESLQPRVIVVDDFHLLNAAERAEVGSSLKRISDRTFERPEAPPKAILIGIPTTGVSLLSEASDLGPRLGQYVLERATDREIDRLISEGENALDILFDDRDVLLSESAGNFWLAQYICNKVCASQEIYETQDKTRIVTFDLLRLRHRLMTELTQRYSKTAQTLARGKKWRPWGNKPYLEILLALCKIPESVVTFDKLLNMVPERRRPGIKAVRPRIAEVIYDPSKSIDLRKQIAFDTEAGFSIEDPLFRYFLTNLDQRRLFQDMGVEDRAVESGRIFSYDVGFSFAGETRKIVEAINVQLKSEDVVTFYDYDQQAFLLGHDLEETLGRVYAESCRYYLVFLDRHFSEKVWTNYEKDVMTARGCKNHIIPVILDESGRSGSVGIRSTIGHIDLRDIWAEIQRSGILSNDSINALRNRCVLPILEKIDAASDTI
ncbi:MAG: TIR domain-containing protein [Verrucomicrobia bacterium]|jgi:hypothetical protein|nr:TIR domain-containing protein [Verrucomicrobiota bacterium]